MLGLWAFVLGGGGGLLEGPFAAASVCDLEGRAVHPRDREHTEGALTITGVELNPGWSSSQWR